MEVFQMSDDLSEMKDKLRESEKMYDQAMTTLETSSSTAHRQQREIEELDEQVEDMLLEEYEGEEELDLLIFDDEHFCKNCHGWNIQILMRVDHTNEQEFCVKMTCRANPGIFFKLKPGYPTEGNAKALALRFINEVVIRKEKGARA